jgi:uncharacterized SAM-binding protein YcdF (DUF218 family)
MYALKQLVGTLAMPLVFAMLLAIVGIAFRALRWPRTSRWVWIVAAAIAWLSALPITGDALLLPLESRYAPLDVERWSGKATHVVVLGSSYTPRGNVPVTAALDDEALARSLGVDPESLIVFDRPLDTGDEAREVYALLGATPFVLVTSAYHMPRAVLLMERAGAHPIPAPTAQRVWAGPMRSVRGFLPGARGLRKTELALHEYVGLLATRLGLDD